MSTSVKAFRNHLLQADSEALCQAWIRAISRTIQHLHEDDNSYHLPHLPFESKVEAAFASNVPFGSVQPRNGRPPSSATPSSSKASLRESTTSDADPPKFGIAQRPHAASSASSSSTTQESQQFYEELRHIPGNDVCADCGSRNPKWASINLGVLLCIECCGVHRSLGVHLSKVRSLTMDSLEPEQRKVMLQLGNHKVNAVYLAFVPQTDVVPPPARDQSSRLVRESWITAKYVEKRFTRPDFQRAFQNVKTHGRSSSAHDMSTYGIMHYNTVANLDLNGRAEDDWPTTSTSTTSEKATVSAAMLPGIIAASAVLDVRQPAANRLSRLSSGSETNLDASGKELRASVSSHASIGMHPPSESEILEALETGNLEKVLSLMARGFDLNSRVDGTYPLHIAVSSHQTTLIEFLLLNGAKINAVDGLLNSALHVAAMRGHTIEVYQLLKRKADTELRNLIGHTPLDLAVEAQHADIVTLLRLHDMREDDDFNTSQTVDEFISDLASRQKLNAKEDNQA